MIVYKNIWYVVKLSIFFQRFFLIRVALYTSPALETLYAFGRFFSRGTMALYTSPCLQKDNISYDESDSTAFRSQKSAQVM